MQSKNTSVIITGLLLALTAPSSAWARSHKHKASAQTAAPVAPSDDQKVDISGLENKYWAPKDTDFSVVQNRAYSKEHRHFVTLEGGMSINDPHSSGTVFGVNYNYFFSERYGIQATYLKANLSANESTRDLADLGSGVQPDYDRFTGYYGLGFNWVPFYAKMSFLGKKILYFDMSFTPTLGVATYDQELEHGNRHRSSIAYGFDFTQYFFLSHWFALRVDLKNQWRPEQVLKYRDTSVSGSIQHEGTLVKTQTAQDSLFMIGATFYFK